MKPGFKVTDPSEHNLRLHEENPVYMYVHVRACLKIESLIEKLFQRLPAPN